MAFEMMWAGYYRALLNVFICWRWKESDYGFKISIVFTSSSHSLFSGFISYIISFNLIKNISYWIKSFLQ